MVQLWSTVVFDRNNEINKGIVTFYDHNEDYEYFEITISNNNFFDWIGVISYDNETYETLDNKVFYFHELEESYKSPLHSLKENDQIVAESYYPNEYTGGIGIIQEINDDYNLTIKFETIEELVSINTKNGLSKFMKISNLELVKTSNQKLEFSVPFIINNTPFAIPYNDRKLNQKERIKFLFLELVGIDTTRSEDSIQRAKRTAERIIQMSIPDDFEMKEWPVKSRFFPLSYKKTIFHANNPEQFKNTLS